MLFRSSIFNAVVVQTVSVLSCGRAIEGKVAFLGGPLYFLSELRTAFKNVLNLGDKDIVFPKDAQLYIAMGASILAKDEPDVNLSDLINKIKEIEDVNLSNSEGLEPLFRNQEEYDEFLNRHNKAQVTKKDLNKIKGNCFLGIDAGSTTTKAALIDEDCNLVYTYYSSNEGSPLKTSINIEIGRASCRERV